MIQDLSALQKTSFMDQSSLAEIFTCKTVGQGIRKAIGQVNTNALAAWGTW
ncbi:MAG: hypothetical protein K6E38_00075 [Fretibacterium sp.]|nr:hypothetical protein [Fretibacterium sp.]